MSTVTPLHALDAPRTETHTKKVAKKSWPPALKKHKLVGRAQTTIYSLVVGGHVLVLAWVGIYYLGLETIHPVKLYWDTLLSQHVHLLSQPHWNTWRHLFRDGGESYLGTMGVMLFIYNPYKHSVRRLTSGWQVGAVCLTALLVAVPIFVFGGLAIGWVQHWFHTGTLAPTISGNPNLAEKLYSSSWTTKVVAAAAGFVGAKRVMNPVYDLTIRWFAERKVSRGRHVHFWHPRAYAGLVQDLYAAYGTKAEAQAQAAQAQADRGQALNRALVASTVVVLCLAVYGAHILSQAG